MPPFDDVPRNSQGWEELEGFLIPEPSEPPPIPTPQSTANVRMNQLQDMLRQQTGFISQATPLHEEPAAEVTTNTPHNSQVEIVETITFADEDSYHAEIDNLEMNGTVDNVDDNDDGTITVTYIHNRPRQSNPLQVFGGARTFGGFDMFSSPSPSKSLDNETLIKLSKAVNLLEAAKSKRAQQMKQLRGKREGQYIKMLRDDKRRNMTFIEIVGSEVPIRIAEFGWSKIRQVLDTIRMSEVDIKDGNYKLHCASTGCKLEEVPFDYAYFCNNHVYCAEHVPDLKLCDSCVELYSKTKAVKTYDGKVLSICGNCLERFLERGCRTCRGGTTIEYISAGVCARCVEKNPHSNPYHSFSKSLRWVSTDKGEVVQSTRIYSTEIEALSPSIDHASQLYKLLPQEVGIATDGSVTANDGRAYGFELQTPRLAGKRGEELVRRMTSSVKGVEAHVNESCGMHVHIDGKGLIPQERKEYPAALINLWKAYLVFEDVLMSVVPYSRRNNDFCRRLSEAFQINELDTIENMVDVEKMWYKARTTQDIRQAKHQHYSTTRYFGVNFHCLLNDGHFEIRFHPGTLNPKKVLEWANLHTLIADASVNLMFTPEFLREAQATYHLQEKAALLFDRIGMSKSSKEYFISRQRKFADKKNRDEETKANGESHRGNVLTVSDDF
jgi:hypothetical protein